jgi:hypothetical protein
MPSFEHSGTPINWALEGEELLCLRCRRDRAGEDAVAAAGEAASGAERVKARRTGTIDFEILRDGSRANGVIARCCGTSPAVIAKARERLGVDVHVIQPGQG